MHSYNQSKSYLTVILHGLQKRNTECWWTWSDSVARLTVTFISWASKCFQFWNPPQDPRLLPFRCNSHSYLLVIRYFQHKHTQSAKEEYRWGWTCRFSSHTLGLPTWLTRTQPLTAWRMKPPSFLVPSFSSHSQVRQFTTAHRARLSLGRAVPRYSPCRSQ